MPTMHKRFSLAEQMSVARSLGNCIQFPIEILMADLISCNDELIALRQLEAVVRACGLPTMMVSGQQQLEWFAIALKIVEDARNSPSEKR